MASPKKQRTSFSQGSDEDYNIVCLPCHRDEAIILAFGYCIDCQEHLCHACYKHHKDAALSRHHKLQDKNTMPSQASNDVFQKEKVMRDISTKPGTAAGSSSQFSLQSPSGNCDISTQPGTTAGSSSQFSQQPPSADHTITATCLGEICVKATDDRYGCWISGMAVLPTDRLVLCDRDNHSIKLIDVNSKSIISQLSLEPETEDGPWDTAWDITSITSTQVAVNAPDRQHIQFISVSDIELSKDHTIHTDGECTCLYFYQDKFIVTYFNPRKLEILDIKGNVITQVKADSTGKDIFDDPGYIQANSSSIYVSDDGLKEVIMLNWSGEITGRITDVGDPHGIALLGDGSLLVSDNAGDVVYQVSACTSRKSVLVYVEGPLTLCVDYTGHKLYISRCCPSVPHVDDNILIYNI